MNLRDWIWSSIVILLMMVAVISTQLDWAPNPFSYTLVIILSVIAASAFLCLCKIVTHTRIRRKLTSKAAVLYSVLSFIEVVLFCLLVSWVGWEVPTLFGALLISALEVTVVAYRFHSAEKENSPTWRQAFVHACLVVGVFPLLTCSLLGFQEIWRS